MLMRLPLRGGRWSQAMAPYETRSVTNQRTLFERAGVRGVRASKDKGQVSAESFFSVHKGNLGLAGGV